MDKMEHNVCYQCGGAGCHHCGTVVNLHDHMALTCDCGSVNFCLLRTGKIECAKCQTVINKQWITHTDIKTEDLPRWHNDKSTT